MWRPRSAARAVAAPILPRAVDRMSVPSRPRWIPFRDGSNSVSARDRPPDLFCFAGVGDKFPRRFRGRPQQKTAMSLFVQKYGGTSVGTIERIRAVAHKVAAARARGEDLVVVVSAMSGETNRLIALAHEISEMPSPREPDVLVSTGEQVTIALLAMALKELVCAARSYTGSQIRILTDSAHTKARIEAIDVERIRADLAAGRVVVVAGFQGV